MTNYNLSELVLAAVVWGAALTMTPVVRADSTAAGVSPVERGRYLARAGNCVSCHTREDGRPFAGGLAFATPFGRIYSTNITPDPDTGIGNWSEAQFARALREGVRPNGEHLYPAFPYTAYTKMSDRDVAALFAYFKTLTPVKAPATANEMRFPFNQRWALSLWKALFFEEGRFEPQSDRSDEWNRGAYLVDGLGHCSACHAPRNFMGAERNGMTGGELSDKVNSVDVRTWSAPNLTNVPNGLGAWTVEEVASYLKIGRNKFTETHGPMNDVVLNSTRHLTDADVQAMAVYLKSLPGDAGDIGRPAKAEVLQEGATLYDVHCGTCHLPTGMGSSSADAGAQLVGSPLVQASNPASLINVILYGPRLAKLPTPKRWKDMPAFGEKLGDDEIAAIASYMRATWGNVGGAVTEEQVSKQR